MPQKAFHLAAAATWLAVGLTSAIAAEPETSQAHFDHDVSNFHAPARAFARRGGTELASIHEVAASNHAWLHAGAKHHKKGE